MGFVNFYKACCVDDIRTDVYRVYVTDSLRYGERERYWDLINPKPEDNRKPEEIIGSIMGKLKGSEQA